MNTKTKKKVTMRESNQTELQINQNTIDIMLTRKDINDMKENHLAHLAADIRSLDKKVEKIDFRLWSIMVLIVMSAGANYFI